MRVETVPGEAGDLIETTGPKIHRQHSQVRDAERHPSTAEAKAEPTHKL